LAAPRRHWLSRACSVLIPVLALLSCGFPSYTFSVQDDAGPQICGAGVADCNGQPDDGCETSIDTVSNCGNCATECTNDHGTTRCALTGETTACAPVCAAGFADCDLNPGNGCETNLNGDSLNCGACGTACPANGGTASCVAGICGVSSCNAGFGDCQNIGKCTINLQTDPLNCGNCGNACPNSHGTASCNAGICQIRCDTGWGDCNAASEDGGSSPADGCETKLNVPDSTGGVPNCGACGNNCSRRSYTTIDLAECELGTCARDCLYGTGDCDNNRDDPACTGSSCGCEVSFGSNANNCGACGHACKGGACVNDACQCPDSEPKSGSTKCSLASTVSCGAYGSSGCACSCTSGVFKCTDKSGKAC
jgi:hypothetical protein